jgi:hypothetical protein
MRMLTPFDAWRAGLEMARLGIEAQAVIWLRGIGAAGAWDTPFDEGWRALREKPEAFAEAIGPRGRGGDPGAGRGAGDPGGRRPADAARAGQPQAARGSRTEAAGRMRVLALIAVLAGPVSARQGSGRRIIGQLIDSRAATRAGRATEGKDETDVRYLRAMNAQREAERMLTRRNFFKDSTAAAARDPTMCDICV